MRASALILAAWLPSAAAMAGPAAPTPGAQRILDLHNRERASVGVPQLRWNTRLELDATEHAAQLARLGSLVHAPREGRGNVRENLSRGSLGWGPDLLMRNWLNERRYFHGGIYPDVCTGGWSRCVHYTQVIWPGTTDVGCGSATGKGFSWFVCRYSPGGNKDGRRLTAIQRVGTPGQASRQANLYTLCHPSSKHLAETQQALKQALEQRKALETEMRRVKAAIDAEVSGIANYDPSLIEKLLGTTQVPSTEKLKALSNRLRELQDEIREEQRRIDAILKALQDVQHRFDAHCRDQVDVRQ